MFRYNFVWFACSFPALFKLVALLFIFSTALTNMSEILVDIFIDLTMSNRMADVFLLCNFTTTPKNYWQTSHNNSFFFFKHGWWKHDLPPVTDAFVLSFWHSCDMKCKNRLICAVALTIVWVKTRYSAIACLSGQQPVFLQKQDPRRASLITHVDTRNISTNRIRSQRLKFCTRCQKSIFFFFFAWDY